jgi:hypothetical protein
VPGSGALNSGNCRKWSGVAELDRRREHQHACRIFEQERGLSGISGSLELERKSASSRKRGMISSVFSWRPPFMSDAS